MRRVAVSMAAVLAVLVVLATSEFPAEQECPEECDCHYFRVNYVTDCSESNLTEIPYEEISLNVYILDMNGNEISEIKPFPEDIKVRRLQLAENKLTKVTSSMFLGLRYMVDVDLSSNDISEVDPDAFRDSHGLITIELQNNPLTDAGAGPFLRCRSLLYLDISNCGLKHLDSDFFAEIPLLTHLDLSGNPLGKVEPSAFGPLATLSELVLSGCSLTDLDPGLLEKQTHLKLLDLSENKLSAANWVPIFRNLPRLENLNLRKADIKNLPEDVFAHNTFLRILTLSDNELADLDVGTTLGRNLENLHSLDLSKCRLSGPLDENSFGNATTLRTLNLSGNRLSSRDLSVALSPLTRLATLSLKDCSLSKLPRNTFENLSRLEELDISWNPLDNVFEDLLDSLKNLRYLNMGYSNLSRLSRDTFSKTTNLKRLILSGNKLGELETGLFKNLRLIETLEIENCGLEKAIDEDVFYNKTYGDLSELKMSGNPLKIKEGALFPEQMCRLRVLDLSDCNISYLPDESFVHAKNLSRLLLGNNKFSSEFMADSAFLDLLANLEYLDLSSNNLTVLPTRVIRKTQVRDIKLTNNPWVCDCTLAEWWNWAIDKGDISHLVGSTLTLDDVTKKGSKRKKGLLCRVDSKITPPTRKNSTATFRKQRPRVETTNKTWARYLKESNCPIKKITTEQKSDIHVFFPEPILPSPLPEVLLPEGERPPSSERRRLQAVAISFALLALLSSAGVAYRVRRRRRPRPRPSPAPTSPLPSRPGLFGLFGFFGLDRRFARLPPPLPFSAAQ